MTFSSFCWLADFGLRISFGEFYSLEPVDVGNSISQEYKARDLLS
jgi:hypothetical protein